VKPDTSLNEIDSTIRPDTSKLPSQSSESSTFPSTSSRPEIQTSIQPVSTSGPIVPSQTTSSSYLPPSSTYLPSTMQVTESVSYIPPATQMTTTSVSYLPPSSTTTSLISESTPESVSYLPPDISITTTTLPSSISSTISSPQIGKFRCTKEGFFPNLNNCKKFYRCVQDHSKYQKYEFECGPGTAWDQSIQTCNHIEKVASCSKGNEINQDFNPSTSDSISGFPAMSSSTTIVSSQTTATTLSSPVPISTESTTANTPSETSTESATSETDKTESSSTITTITSISTSENLASERPEEIQMPGSSSTESSSESSSESLPTSESNQLSSSTESHVPDCATQKPSNAIICNNEGFYPHPTRCDKFYRCVNNGNGFNVYHFDCPPGTIFDSSINVCNYPESVYPAKDCMIGNTSSNVESTTQSETPEQSTSTTIVTQSTAQQTEESIITSSELDTTTSSMETTSEGTVTTSSIESTTLNMLESTESMIESTIESTTTTTEAATDSSISEQSSEATTEATASTESETSTTESQEQSTESERSTTESQEQSTTESKEPSSTETQEQSTTELQEQSTTESQEQTTTQSESTTTESEVAAPCSIGNLTDDQITLVCPTGFRRHPKYCNLFYQCTSEGNMEIKILVLSCPENTIFDEKTIQCLPASRSSQPCTSTTTSTRFYRRLENHALSPVSISK